MTQNDPSGANEPLQAIQKEQTKINSGKLIIFFGMSAGVGKTYAMLEEAQQRLKEGVHVIVGTVNTHGRKEIEALLQGLTIIPEIRVKDEDIAFEEIDLEAILKQKPSLVVIDELAHANAPGSRHAKRWQDVIELLDAGVEVYTTLNVQQVESRKEMVESFVDFKIHETVPDMIIERASTIELVDISHSELLQRLDDGKVYLGDQSTIAAKKFFKEDTLMALRQIALRLTAEKVDHDLHVFLSQAKGWKTRERLMVAISPSPYSQQLIRATRRRAFELDAPWTAVYVDTGNILTDAEQTRLANHLNLARDLGADVMVTHDLDLAAALQQIARQKNISQLIIGRPAHQSFLKKIFKESLVDRLERENKQLDLHILRQDRLTRVYHEIHSVIPSFRDSIRDYVIAIASVIGLTFIGFLLNPFIGYQAVGFIFLLGISILSFFVKQGPIFLAALLSTLTWDVFFIPPIYSLWVTTVENFALLITYFTTAIIIGLMTHRIHKKDRFLKMRKKKLENLYEIERDIASSTNDQELRLNVIARLQSIFNGKFEILIKDKNNQLIFDSQLPLLQQEKERAAAAWVFQNGKIAGWSTSTLPSAAGLYFPIKLSQIIAGVLIYYPKRDRPPSLDEINFLQTVAQHLGVYLGHV